jgi:hypothetical protein
LAQPVAPLMAVIGLVFAVATTGKPAVVLAVAILILIVVVVAILIVYTKTFRHP